MSATGAPVNRAVQQSVDGQLDPRRKKKGYNQSRNQLNSPNGKSRSANNGNSGGNNFNGSAFANAGANPRSRNTSQKQGEVKGKRKPREESKLRKEILKDEYMQAEDISMVPTKRLPRLRDVPVQEFTLMELQQTGTLFESPESLGFLRKGPGHPNRLVPRYMLTQPRLLKTPPFQQNPWDVQNQNKMLQMEAANNGNDYQGIYEIFQKMRDTERKKMEELGLVDAENITKDLNDAIFFQGSCLDMCPTFERVRRALENNVKSLEKDPHTNKISRDRAIKAFSRPAAGQPPPMPSDVRPPHVLTHTLDYIVDNILPQLPEAHSFIWDRTRSIRQDFVYQNFYGPEAIDCNERIVRIHLVSLHIMSGSDVEYSQQQELEQFNKALQTLTEIYQDVRNHGGICPNEAEFRAYHLISHFRDPELEREIQTLPDHILKDRLVQLALRFRFLMSQNNIVERSYTNCIGGMNLFVEFFRLVYSEQTPILLACLLETHFNEIRFYALKSMSRSYHTKGRALLASSLKEMLGFDNVEQLIKYISYFEVDTIVESGVTLIDLFNKDKLESKYRLNSLQDKPKQSQAFSMKLDSKLKLRLLRDIVNSGKRNADLKIRDSLKNYTVQNVQRRFPQARNGNIASQNSHIGSSLKEDQPQDVKPLSQNFTTNNQKPLSTKFQQLPNLDHSADAAKSEKSLNILDFLNYQKATTSTPPKQLFGFINSQKPVTSTPAFDFTSHLNSISQPKTTSHFVSSTGDHNTPQLQPQPVQENKNIISTLQDVSKFNFKKNEAQHSKLPVSGTLSTKEILFKNLDFDKIKKTTSSEKETAPIVKYSLLKESPQFIQAVRSIYASILSEVVETELGKLLPRIIKYENRNNERKKVIETLAGELFLAFLSELTYETLQVSVADNFYQKKITKKMWEKWKKNKEKKKTTNEFRLRKLAELNSLHFKTPTLKRMNSSPSRNNSFSKKIRIPLNCNSSFENIHERQEEIQKLWMPLNLHEFVERCTKNVKVLPNSERTELKCLLIVEDWALPYSKWLNTKFSLRSSQDKTHYENRVETEKMVISFESLPKNNSLQEAMFRRTGFIIFECGILHESQAATYKTFSDKLSRDRAILKKIVQICDRYCLYQTQIMVLIWDIQGTQNEKGEVARILNVNEIEKSSSCVQGITLCDMSSLASNVFETLEMGLRTMSLRFTGNLTYRGLKKKLKLQNQLEEKARREQRSMLENHAQAQKETEDLLKSKEEEVLRRAKELQKHKYLSQHLVSGVNDTVDLSNTTASFRTPNATFANNTLVNLNESFLANDSTIHLRNASLLGSFCNASILEESTPFGSPKPKAPVSVTTSSGFTKPAVPRKIQELRELTASIRSKYNK